MNDRNTIIIKKIIQYCDQIAGTVDRFGKDSNLFFEDYIFSNACNMCILQIGELVGKLDDAFKQKHTNIPWREIKAMRNIYAHNYQQVDLEFAWNTVIYDIPMLKDACERIIEEL